MLPEKEIEQSALAMPAIVLACDSSWTLSHGLAVLEKTKWGPELVCQSRLLVGSFGEQFGIPWSKIHVEIIQPQTKNKLPPMFPWNNASCVPTSQVRAKKRQSAGI
jgi:hypothetical protein